MIEPELNQAAISTSVTTDCATIYLQQPTSIILVEDLNPLVSETYIEWSILNTLCCFCTGTLVLLCSLPALCYSIKVQELNEMQRYTEARRVSIYARKFNQFATCIVIYILILTFVLVTRWHSYHYLFYG